MFTILMYGAMIFMLAKKMGLQGWELYVPGYGLFMFFLSVFQEKEHPWRFILLLLFGPLIVGILLIVIFKAFGAVLIILLYIAALIYLLITLIRFFEKLYGVRIRKLLFLLFWFAYIPYLVYNDVPNNDDAVSRYCAKLFFSKEKNEYSEFANNDGSWMQDDDSISIEDLAAEFDVEEYLIRNILYDKKNVGRFKYQNVSGRIRIAKEDKAAILDELEGGKEKKKNKNRIVSAEKPDDTGSTSVTEVVRGKIKESEPESKRYDFDDLPEL